MQGGYNIHALIEALDNDKLALLRQKSLIPYLMFDSFMTLKKKASRQRLR